MSDKPCRLILLVLQPSAVCKDIAESFIPTVHQYTETENAKAELDMDRMLGRSGSDMQLIPDCAVASIAYDPVDVGIAYRYVEKIRKGKFNIKMKGLGYKSNT